MNINIFMLIFIAILQTYGVCFTELDHCVSHTQTNACMHAHTLTHTYTCTHAETHTHKHKLIELHIMSLKNSIMAAF